jgi:hypothetical protein
VQTDPAAQSASAKIIELLLCFQAATPTSRSVSICQDEAWEPKESRFQQGHQGAQIKALYHLEMRRYADPVA